MMKMEGIITPIVTPFHRDAEQIFSQFEIAKDSGFKKYLNKYNTISVNSPGFTPDSLASGYVIARLLILLQRYRFILYYLR